MNSVENSQIHRSISMPVKPQHLEPKSLQRSQEKEVLYEEDYYPESSNFEQSKEHAVNDNGSPSRSDNNIPYINEWTGSTIELNTNLRRNEIDPIYARRLPNRVIEKNGHENVIFRRIPEKSWRYIRDFVTTLVRPFLRFLPKKSITPKASKANELTTTASNNDHPSLVTKPNSESSEPDFYKITPSIEQKLNELEEFDQNSVRNRQNEITRERVTFSL